MKVNKKTLGGMSVAAAALAGLLASGVASADVKSPEGFNKTAYALAGNSAFGLNGHDGKEDKCKGEDGCKGNEGDKEKCKGHEGDKEKCKGHEGDKEKCKGHEGK